MDRALTSAAMRKADHRTIQEFGVPEFTLMETAGRAAVRVMLEALPKSSAPRFGILCGRGNNGGDGLVMARVLNEMGFEVRVFMAEGGDRLSQSAAMNLSLITQLDIPRVSTVEELAGTTVWIDAMLGTGINASPRTPYDHLVTWLNVQVGITVAIDLPTGLHGDTGQVLGEVVLADQTIALGALKTGLLLNDGPASAGKVVCVPIGIPEFILTSESGAPGCADVSNDDFVRSHLPARHRTDTKYTSGPAIVIGGSVKYPGAPSLAARAAARVGSGYVVKALGTDTPRTGETEIPVIDQSMDELGPAIDRAKAVLVGPGLGRGEDAVRLVSDVLDRAQCPVVIDADGLRALAQLGRLPSTGNWILTPHQSEFRSLVGSDVSMNDPVRLAREWADRWNVTLILKDLPSIIASPGRTPVICGTGNSALGTAGSGDVLAGLCTGLLAMGLDCHAAAVSATHMGGAASDRYVRDRGHRSMMASDLIRQIPLLLSERFDH